MRYLTGNSWPSCGDSEQGQKTHFFHRHKPHNISEEKIKTLGCWDQRFRKRYSGSSSSLKAATSPVNHTKLEVFSLHFTLDSVNRAVQPSFSRDLISKLLQVFFFHAYFQPLPTFFLSTLSTSRPDGTSDLLDFLRVWHRATLLIPEVPE